jgi:hypothetical protein
MNEQQTDEKRGFAESVLYEFSVSLNTQEKLHAFVEGLTTAFSEICEKKYTDDFFFDIIKPVLTRLIRLKDDTEKEFRYFGDFVGKKSCTNEGTAYALEIFQGFLEDIDDVLSSYDVIPFKCAETIFNPKKQTVVKKLTTDNPKLMKTVVESLSFGYERKGIVISKERVSAYAVNGQ